jgi:hypothetical protein
LLLGWIASQEFHSIILHGLHFDKPKQKQVLGWSMALGELSEDWAAVFYYAVCLDPTCAHGWPEQVRKSMFFFLEFGVDWRPQEGIVRSGQIYLGVMSFPSLWCHQSCPPKSIMPTASQLTSSSSQSPDTVSYSLKVVSTARIKQPRTIRNLEGRKKESDDVLVLASFTGKDREMCQPW